MRDDTEIKRSVKEFRRIIANLEKIGPGKTRNPHTILRIEELRRKARTLLYICKATGLYGEDLQEMERFVKVAEEFLPTPGTHKNN